MPWGTVAVQKGKVCHSLIEGIEIPAADSALGARFYNGHYLLFARLDIRRHLKIHHEISSDVYLRIKIGTYALF